MLIQQRGFGSIHKVPPSIFWQSADNTLIHPKIALNRERKKALRKKLATLTDKTERQRKIKRREEIKDKGDRDKEKGKKWRKKNFNDKSENSWITSGKLGLW